MREMQNVPDGTALIESDGLIAALTYRNGGLIAGYVYDASADADELEHLK